MNTTGDAAEQTFRLVIEETEFLLRISGSLIKETLTMLYAISKDNKQNSIGKTKLSNMLKNCKDIRIFTIQKKDLDKFVEEAKNYGIYYCTLIDKTNKSDDAIVDIMVRGDDAPRVNRIVERFDLSITDTASLRTEAIKENGKEVVVNQDEQENHEPSVDDNKMADIMGRNEEQTEEKSNVQSVDDDKMADIMGISQVKEDEVKDGVSDDFLDKAEVPLEHSLENIKEEIPQKEGKVSVRELLDGFKNEVKEKVKEKISKKDKSPKTKKKNKNKNKKVGGKKFDKSR